MPRTIACGAAGGRMSIPAYRKPTFHATIGIDRGPRPQNLASFPAVADAYAPPREAIEEGGIPLAHSWNENRIDSE